MDFQLTEEQVALQDAIRSFCEANYSFEIIAALDEDPLRLDNWQRLVDTIPAEDFVTAAETQANVTAGVVPRLHLGAVERALAEHLAAVDSLTS